MNLFTKQKQTYRYKKQTSWLRKGKCGLGGRDKSGPWDEHTPTTIYKTDNQQGPTV